MARILIAGCGDLGCELGSQLFEKGHEVFGIRRDVSQVPGCIQPIATDLFSQTPTLPENLDYVFYIVSANGYKDGAYYQAYVLGVKHILKALAGQNIKRIFFISSSSVFGQSDGEWVTEDSPVDGKNFASKRLLEGEEAISSSEFASTTIRFGGIYGPGRTHLIDLVMEGKAHCMEGIYSNRIHSADCIGMMIHLMEMNKPEQLYIGVDNEPTPTCDVYEWLAEQLSVSNIEHLEPTENSRMQRSNKRLSNEKIRSAGYEFKYPSFRDGYSRLIENQ